MAGSRRRAHTVTLDDARVGIVKRPPKIIALEDETAEAIGASEGTVRRDWTMAKLQLLRELRKR
jgi:hypothetical protein